MFQTLLEAACPQTIGWPHVAIALVGTCGVCFIAWALFRNE